MKDGLPVPTGHETEGPEMTTSRDADRSASGPVSASVLFDGEVAFGFEEIFFSRTDERGVIQAGNDVFQRVSQIAWTRLIGAPHRIIRHPAMPRAAFFILWDRLKKGLPTGAYVRNRAEDGRSYWVFAVIVPIPGGYLSVRIKPGSALSETVKSVYADILAMEAGGMAPSESARALLERLSAAGFPSYESFQARALATEVIWRARQSGRAAPPLGDAIATAESADGMETELNNMREMFDTALMIAINLRIVASQLGDRGRPVSAISSNYALLANDMTSWLNTRALPKDGGFSGIARSVNEGLFLSNAALILAEMARNFTTHSETGGSDPVAEKAILAQVAKDYHNRAELCLQRVMNEAISMESRLQEMRHHGTGLNSIRMLCRIEGAPLRHKGGGDIDQIVEKLDTFQDELGSRLGRIIAMGQKIQRAAAVLG